MFTGGVVSWEDGTPQRHNEKKLREGTIFNSMDRAKEMSIGW